MAPNFASFIADAKGRGPISMEEEKGTATVFLVKR
jgi:hypothetical protein